ncbi:MAG TPA: hypothetical protein VFA99_04485 [Acidobacteriaceae bacterium]|nr:hypothetical protein [Acidobacteriaceae bacterium]
MSNLKYIAAPQLVPLPVAGVALAAVACAMLISSPVRPSIEHMTHLLHVAHPRIVGGAAAGAAIVATAFWLWVRSRRPSPEELERRRRDHLATMGRITDGVLIDARTLGGEETNETAPEVLIYSYRLAGVTYDCAQDVSKLPERVTGWRLDQPLQVRYDPRNPGNSVVVAESWSGLWQERPEPRLSRLTAQTQATR